MSTMETGQVQGFKLNQVSGAELAGAVLCFLLLIPRATSAWNKWWNVSGPYQSAVDHFQHGLYLAANKKLDSVKAGAPKAYSPRELQAMSLYLQKDLPRAQAAYQELASASGLTGARNRESMARLAVANLKLLTWARGKDPKMTDSAYAAARKDAEDTINKTRNTNFIEPEVVAAQLTLDTLPVPNPTRFSPWVRDKDEELEALLGKLKDVEKRLLSKKLICSPQGGAVFYNTMGIVHYRLARSKWAEIQLKMFQQQPTARAKWRSANQELFEVASSHSSLAIDAFKAATQYRQEWVTPMSNFERALGAKLVEDTYKVVLTDEKRKALIDYAELYVLSQRFFGDFWYIIGKRPKKGDTMLDPEVKADPPTALAPIDGRLNRYSLEGNLGWAYVLIGQARGSGLSWLGRSTKHNKDGPVIYNIARAKSEQWKEIVGTLYNDSDVRQLIQGVQKNYDSALKSIGRYGSPELRRVRLLNNYGVYLCHRDEKKLACGAGMQQLALAHNHLKKVLESGNAGMIDMVEREGLAEIVRSNLLTAAKMTLETEGPSIDQKNQAQSILRDN